MNKQARELRRLARSLGWEPYRYTGKHEIWKAQSGYRMPLPGTPASPQSARNIEAKLRRYA